MKKIYTYITLTALLFFYTQNCMASEIIKKTIDGISYGIWQGLSTEEDYAYVTSPEKGSSYSGEITIPEFIYYKGKKYTVKEIGYLSFYYARVSKLTLPNTIREIDSQAFLACGSLSELRIPSSVKKIGKRAFGGCLFSLIIETNYDINWSEALKDFNNSSLICNYSAIGA